MKEPALLPCPCCGGAPILNVLAVNYGHGNGGFGYFAVCKCGMQTRRFDDYGQTEEQCKEKAAAVWNARLGAPEIERNLMALADELYEEGYMCGIKSDPEQRWLRAWATAMQRVAAGQSYDGQTVTAIYREQNGA